MNAFSTSSRLPPWLEQAWLERYLDRLLTAEENAWFEAYVLDKPELLSLIDADSTLRDAFATAGKSIEPATTDVARLEPRRGIGTQRTMPHWPAAAAALVVGLGIGGMFEHSATRRAAPGIVASPTRMIFDAMRGTEPNRRVEHAGSNSPYVLVEVAVPPDATDVSVEIGGETRNGLTVSADGFVSFLVDAGAQRTARNATLSYLSRGARVTQPLDLQLSGGKANE